MKQLILLLSLLPYFGYTQTCDPDAVYAVEDANAVCYEVVDNVRYVYTNNYPDHDDTSISKSSFDLAASDKEYAMCAYPEKSASTTPLYEETETTVGCTYNYTFGVSINGVKYDPSSAEYFENTETGENNIEWHVEARYIFSSGFGNNGGHLNPFGEYHYHDIPADYFTNDLNIDGSEHSPIVGYSADGFPIYYKYIYTDATDSTSAILTASSSYSLKSGSRPGDGVSAPDGAYSGLYYEDYEYSAASAVLDECNGRYGVTPDYPYGTYYYVLTDNYPYIPRCFKGTAVDNTFRVGPGPSCPASTASTDCAVAVYGCMDPFSTNYNPDANVDDGSCTYSSCETSITMDSSSEPSCFNTSDGSITVSISGFTNPTYSWSSGGTSETESGLSAGTYTVTVTGDECTDELEITLSAPDTLTYTVSSTEASCGGSDGSLTFTASGGDGGPYTYSIDGGTTFQSSGAFSGLASGTHSIIIKDASGCQINASGTVSETGAPVAPSVSGDATYCSGEAIVDLTVTGNGGTYAWYSDEGLTNMLATGTSTYTPSETSGAVTYYVTESSGDCESPAATATVTINTLPSVEATSTSTMICQGDSVTLSGSGADSYSWDNGVTDGVAFVPTATTTYTVTGTGANNCTATAQVTVTVNETPTVGASATETAICEGNSVTLTGSGATDYSWDNGVTDGVAFTPEETTAYIVTGTSTNGCSGTDTITVEVNPTPTVIADASATTICEGESIVLTGTGAASYSWDNEVVDGASFVPLTSSVYSVTGTDENGCSASDQVSITVNEVPEVTASASSTTLCPGESVTLTGGGASTYSWDRGVTDGEAFTPAETATYTVTGTNLSGCSSTAEVTVSVTNLTAEVSHSGGSLVATASDASYQWIDCSTDEPIAGATSQTFSPGSAGSYAVEVTGNGCTVTSTCLNFTLLSASVQKQVTFYPNPARDIITIRSGSTRDATIRIIDLAGNTLLSQDAEATGETKIDLRAIRPGTYLLQVISEEIQSFKLSKKL